MPTYEYCCRECKHGFERFQKITDPPVEKCPECGGPVEKVLGPGGGFIMKDAGMRSCGREISCCGRETPCSSKPCDKS